MEGSTGDATEGCERTTAFSAGMTALAGLPVYLELAQVVGMRASVERHVRL